MAFKFLLLLPLTRGDAQLFAVGSNSGAGCR
jgi:hypothetical protein